MPVRSEDDWTQAVAQRAPGDRLPIRFRQRGRTVEATLALEPDPRVEVVPTELTGEGPTEAQRAFRDAWLGGRAGLSIRTIPERP